MKGEEKGRVVMAVKGMDAPELEAALNHIHTATGNEL